MMKNLTIHVAVLGTLSLASMQAAALGFESLPATGFSVSGGTSAYRLCNTTGDFGSGIVIKPTTSANNTCAVIPANEATAPDSNFTGLSAFPAASNSQSIVMNNTYTGFTNKTVGTLTQYLWRRAVTGGYECIYGTKVNLTGTDYNTLAAGTQNFEVNDIALGGFGSLNLDVAYSTIPTVSEPTYRIGRTYTSVQRRTGGGYASQPLTGLGSNPSINGLNSYPGTASSTQQLADLDQNWVDFTTDANFLDDDGSTAAASGMVYVRASCSGTNPTVTNNAVRLRQTFQELAGDGATGNWFIEVPVAGFLPTLGSGSVAPAPNAPTNPY